MTDKPQRPDQKVVFGLSTDPQGNICILMQVPPGGWDYMEDGTCHTFDLTKAGLPIKILLAGCKDRADGMKVIERHNQARGIPSLHMPGTDFGINSKT